MKKNTTIGSVKQAARRLVFSCDACKTTTHIKPEDLFLTDKIELSTQKKADGFPLILHLPVSS